LQEKKEASAALFCCISNPRPQNTLAQNKTALASLGFDLLQQRFQMHNTKSAKERLLDLS